MKKPDIPRMELDSFTSVNYTEPLLKVLHYPINSTYFIIEDRENYPVVDYISPNRRNFFKIFHVTGDEGVNLPTINHHLHQINRLIK